jgi:hypothetical protein
MNKYAKELQKKVDRIEKKYNIEREYFKLVNWKSIFGRRNMKK